MLHTDYYFRKPFTPSTINGFTEKQLNIPIYQRLFVWDREQIIQMLDDLWKEMEKGKNNPYYIGIITVVENGDCWDVIDGQQRLTFLSLFAAYILHELKRDNATWRLWHSFLYLAEGGPSSKLRINYSGREDEDQKDLNTIATAVWSSDMGFPVLKNERFLSFLMCTRDFLKDKSKQMEEFAEYVCHRASFLISELPRNYSSIELNLFFERMNSAGKQLSPLDQIKGIYFSEPQFATVFDACLNFEQRYVVDNPKASFNKTLKTILEDTTTTINKEPERSFKAKSRSILDPEIFLLHSLIIALKSNNLNHDADRILKDKNKILETFREHINKKVQIAQLRDAMENYRKWMDDNIIYIDEDDERFLYKIRTKKAPETTSDDDTADEANKQAALIQFQSMLYVSSSEWQEWVLDAYTEPQNMCFLDFLKERDFNRHKLPDDVSCLAYTQTDERYWYWLLDYILWEGYVFRDSKYRIIYNDKDEKVEVSINDYFNRYIDHLQKTPKEKRYIKNSIEYYRFKRNRSREHLHPQTETYNEIKWDDESKHCFGNLAMIADWSNSAQSNDTVGVKFQRLFENQLCNNKLESIKLTLMFLLANGADANWTPDQAKQHGEDMFNLLQFYRDIHVPPNNKE